jgi:HK97 family phage prohead protease
MNEQRVFRNIEVRAVEENGEHFIDLQAITTGVVDDYGSLWEADTFDAYAQTRLPVLCWAHSWADPLGPGVSYNPGPNGPTVRFKFSSFEDVPRARQAFSQVNDGTIRDCSVGFSNTKRRDPTDDEMAQYPGVREVIFEAELDEVSLVLRGAVPGAKVVAFRSANVTAEVPVEFVVDLARKKAAGEITQEEAEAAIDLVATKSKPAPIPDTPGDTVDPVLLEAAQTEADAALAALDDL